MLENVNELLPIGSVVLLNGASKKLMIFGVKQNPEEDTDKEFDYVGVIYPEGHLGKDVQFLFNHEDIETVFFRGYEDEERTEFLGNLRAFYEQNESADGTETDAAEA